MGLITEETWAIERHLAEKSLDISGCLPTGKEPGGRFWDLIDIHYENAVNTGNLNRFLHNHCRFVNRVETERHLHHSVFPSIPSIPLKPCIPGAPVIPPETPCVSVVPPHHPNCCAVAAPEPSSLRVVTIAILAVLFWWIRNRLYG